VITQCSTSDRFSTETTESGTPYHILDRSVHLSHKEYNKSLCAWGARWQIVHLTLPWNTNLAFEGLTMDLRFKHFKFILNFLHKTCCRKEYVVVSMKYFEKEKTRDKGGR